MIAPPIPLNETDRLADLYGYAVLDTGAEEGFDRITGLASTVLGMPIALVSLVDSERQWFKSKVGLGACETARSVSFCAHALDQSEPLVVSDTANDVRFRDNPLVTGDPHIRFYAGAQLTTPRGFDVGTLCVIDRKPREFSAKERQLLIDLAAVVVNELELRAARRLAEQKAASFENLVRVFHQLPQGVVLFDAAFRSVYVNEAMADIFAIPAKELLGLTPEDANARVAELSADPDGTRRALPDLRLQGRESSAVFALNRPRKRVFRRTLHLLADPDRPFLALWTDVTFEDARVRASEVAAATDALTLLPNRRGAELQLAGALASSPSVCVALFDVDHFKRVNDTFGHAAGDEVLRNVASTLAAVARGDDFVARWGGEEFIAILRAESEGARAMAERVRAAVELLDTPAGKITISAGVAQVKHADEVSLADERLYEAKRAGRNRVL